MEQFFFTDLAFWVIYKLPGYDFKAQSTLDELLRMQIYCNHVYHHILIPEQTESQAQRNNPLPVLALVNHDLKGIIRATAALVDGATLNDHLYHLDNAVLNMIAQTYHVMYLLIDGDHEFESGLPVELFLDDTQTNRPKMTALKKQPLAQLLREALLLPGIRNNSFNDLNKLSEEDIARHVARWMSDPKIGGKLLGDTRAKIGALYGALLGLFRVRTLISHARKVAPIYGEISLYGDEQGRAIITSLLRIATHLTDTLSERLIGFFDESRKAHLILKERGKLKAEAPASIAMNGAYQQIQKFGNSKQSLQKQGRKQGRSVSIARVLFRAGQIATKAEQSLCE